MLNKSFYSNGKLLITAEYLVLDGAKALALPTKYGQNLIVEKIDAPILIWNSYDENNQLWFSCNFDLQNLELHSFSDYKTAYTLQQILKETKKLIPIDIRADFLKINKGFKITTKLSFPRDWGLGTSSTLINNIANWANVDAFKLLKNSFGGSGYDIACAKNNTPILFKLENKKQIIEQVYFNPVFKDHLYFIYLNQKQNSRDGIAKYREFQGNVAAVAEEITQITNALLKTEDLTDFEKLLEAHERIIATVIGQKPVQEKLFSDYSGQIKSLGAWGGDFILATGNKDTPNYFKNKGFETIIPFQDMIL